MSYGHICTNYFFLHDGSRLAYNKLTGQIPPQLFQVARYKYCGISDCSKIYVLSMFVNFES